MAARKGTNTGTSIPEQIIYLWLKENFPEGEVHNRYLGYDGLEFDIAIPKLNFVIEYGDGLAHNYLLDTKPKDIEKLKYTQSHGLNLLRIFNLPENDVAYCEDELIVYNGAKDKYLMRQVLPLISHYMEKRYNIKIDYHQVSENLIMRAISNVYKVKYIDSFGKKYPRIAKCWDEELNYCLKPEKVSVDSPHPYTFLCPHCKSRFGVTIADIIKNSTCNYCGINFMLDDLDRLYELDELDGLHENIEYFLLGNIKADCGYDELIKIIIKQGIESGHGEHLRDEHIIKRITDTISVNGYEICGQYKYKIPTKIVERYNMLMETLVCLDIDFSDIKVKLKKYANNKNKETLPFGLLSERNNVGEVEVINNIAYIRGKQVTMTEVYNDYMNLRKKKGIDTDVQFFPQGSIYDITTEKLFYNEFGNIINENQKKYDDTYPTIIPSYIRYC